MDFFRNIFSSIGNFFSGLGFMGNDGGNSGGGSGWSFSSLFGGNSRSSGLQTPPYVPSRDNTPRFPVYGTSGPDVPFGHANRVMNPNIPNSVPNRVYGELNAGARGLMTRLERQGGAAQILGAVAGPMIEGHLKAGQYQYGATYGGYRPTYGGAISCAPTNAPLEPLPNMRGQWNVACQDQGMENRRAWAQSYVADRMIQRGIDRGIHNGTREILNDIYKPKSSGGVFGDAMNKIFDR